MDEPRKIDERTEILINGAKWRHAAKTEPYQQEIKYCEGLRQQAEENAVKYNNWWGKLTGKYYDAAYTVQWEAEHIEYLHKAIAERDEKLEREIDYWTQRGKELKHEHAAASRGEEHPDSVITLPAKGKLPTEWFYQGVFDCVTVNDKNEILAQFTLDLPKGRWKFRMEENRVHGWATVLNDFHILLGAAEPNPGQTRAELKEKVEKEIPLYKAQARKIMMAQLAIQNYKRRHNIPLDKPPLTDDDVNRHTAYNGSDQDKETAQNAAIHTLDV